MILVAVSSKATIVKAIEVMKLSLFFYNYDADSFFFLSYDTGSCFLYNYYTESCLVKNYVLIAIL